MTARSPSVTVIVPTRGRPQALERCLAALETQTLGNRRFEVVVVADGDDPAVGETLQRRHASFDLTILQQERAGPAAARNLGASRARGAALAFTDDDCMPDPGWLAALLRALARRSDSLVGGRTVNALTTNPYAEASQSLLAYLYAAGLARRGALSFVASNNLALTRRTFETMGGFDASFPRAGGEDRELCDRWVTLGGELRYEPDAVVRHAHAMGPQGFLRQHVEYGRGARRLHDARTRRGERRPALEGAGFYVAMVGYPFGRLPLRRALPVAALVAVSQAATVTGYAFELMRRRQAEG
jgi:glycosyltransferase involved in cell wall biosynthesis